MIFDIIFSPPDKTLHALNKLFNDPKLSDVKITFTKGDKSLELYQSSLILAGNFNFFKTAFFSGLKSKVNGYFEFDILIENSEVELEYINDVFKYVNGIDIKLTFESLKTFFYAFQNLQYFRADDFDRRLAASLIDLEDSFMVYYRYPLDLMCIVHLADIYGYWITFISGIRFLKIIYAYSKWKLLSNIDDRDNLLEGIEEYLDNNIMNETTRKNILEKIKQAINVDDPVVDSISDHEIKSDVINYIKYGIKIITIEENLNILSTCLSFNILFYLVYVDFPNIPVFSPDVIMENKESSSLKITISSIIRKKPLIQDYRETLEKVLNEAKDSELKEDVISILHDKNYTDNVVRQKLMELLQNPKYDFEVSGKLTPIFFEQHFFEQEEEEVSSYDTDMIYYGDESFPTKTNTGTYEFRFTFSGKLNTKFGHGNNSTLRPKDAENVYKYLLDLYERRGLIKLISLIQRTFSNGGVIYYKRKDKVKKYGLTNKSTFSFLDIFFKNYKHYHTYISYNF